MFHRYKKEIAVLVITFIVGWMLYRFADIDLDSILTSVKKLPLSTVALVFALSSLQVFFQGLRLHGLLPFKISWFHSVGALAKGQLVNLVVPARGGDLAKIYLLQRNSKDSESSVHQAIGSVLINDKIIDFTALVLISLVGGKVVFQELLKLAPGTQQATIALAILILVPTIVLLSPLKKHLRRLLVQIRKVLESVKQLKKPKPVFLSLSSSLCAWLCEVLAAIILVRSVGFPLDFYQSLWVLVVLNIGIAIPVTAGNVGVFEAAIVYALTTIGLDANTALGLAVVHHVGQVVAPMIIVGLVSPLSYLQRNKAVQ